MAPVSQPAVPTEPAAAPVDEIDEIDENTVLAVRKRVSAKLTLPDGTSVPITASKVLIGRKVTSNDPDVQVINVNDPTRTVSKVHATIERVDGHWYIEDLQSTNGVVVIRDGAEVEIKERSELHGDFLLGDATFVFAEEA